MLCEFECFAAAYVVRYIKSLFHLECSDYKSRPDFGVSNNLAITASLMFAVFTINAEKCS